MSPQWYHLSDSLASLFLKVNDLHGALVRNNSRLRLGKLKANLQIYLLFCSL